MDLIKLRAWWAYKQGLDGALEGASPAETLACTGWARYVGGVVPYLQVFARSGASREQVDKAVAGVGIQELPSARGCVYVTPEVDYGLALAVGASGPEADVAKVGKLGVQREEIEGLGERVLRVIDEAGTPLQTKDLRAALGDAVRDLGPAGKKAGIPHVLQVAVAVFQSRGELRKVHAGGGFEVYKFAYARWTPPRIPAIEEARTELAWRYWTWTGGATLAQFRWFSGFTLRDIKAAVEPLGLVPLTGELLALPGEATAYAEFTPPSRPSYALVSWLDGITLLRRDLATVADEADRDLSLGGHRLSGFSDLPAQGIFDRGRLAGLWEFDADAGVIVWASFVPPDDALLEQIARTEAFVRDQLGDAPGSSMDNPAKRGPRLAALRALAAQASA